MTQDMMTLRALLEKSSDADLLREMIGFTGRAADGTGGRGPDRRRSRRALGGSYHPPQRLPRPELGDAGRHGRVEDPEAEGRGVTSRASWSRGGWPRRRWLR